MEKGRLFMGRYEAKSLLGEGGMGKVYLAYDYDLKRQVVVKVMHDHIASDPKFRERFEHETYLTAQFQHPYAVAVYDAKLEDPQGPCIVMEYIRGITLEKLLEQNKGRLSPARVNRLLSQVCEVLQEAHRKGIVHRDLKPANIMIVDADTPYEKIKVMDFGLAKLSKNARPEAADGGEFAVGTPAYMCPEQVRGEEMDHRGDIYSVGVILYEVITGRLPFSGSDAMDVLLAHATETPPSFAKVGAPEWIPSAVEQVVMACLAKERDDRPTSARELAVRYQQALEMAHVTPEDEAPAESTAPAATGGDGASPADKFAADPTVLVYHLEAWMPEAIASHKLSGWLQDVGADVIESVPGRIRVHLGRPGTVYAAKGGPLSWIGIGKSGLIELELHLSELSDPNRKGVLDIAIVLRSLNGEMPTNPHWLARCKRIFVDLRAYLMGQEGGSRF
jgi:eukaryotic-like serine/threonine-protein kinase